MQNPEPKRDTLIKIQIKRATSPSQEVVFGMLFPSEQQYFWKKICMLNAARLVKFWSGSISGCSTLINDSLLQCFFFGRAGDRKKLPEKSESVYISFKLQTKFKGWMKNICQFKKNAKSTKGPGINNSADSDGASDFLHFPLNIIAGCCFAKKVGIAVKLFREFRFINLSTMTINKRWKIVDLFHSSTTDCGKKVPQICKSNRCKCTDPWHCATIVPELWESDQLD